MSLAPFVLFAAASRPALAQGLPPGWSASPCDAQGNPLTSPQQRNGFYEMDGTKSGKASNLYPKDWVASLGATPPAGGASPLTVTTIPTMQTYNGVGIAGYPTYGSFASNGLGGGIYTYSTPTSSGLINGSVTTHLDGQLVYYFLVQWSGGGTPTVQMPKSISLLLNTNLFASVQLNYGNSKATSGLSATASATDEAFQETASWTGPTYVCGYHLVQASVSPLTATTGIGETYLNGSVDQWASDQVPAGAYVAGHGYQPPNGSAAAVANSTTASANSEVSAGVRQDNRAVSITSSDIETSYFKGPVDATHPTGQWQHLRDTNGSGSIVTDSAVSPPLSQPGGGTSWTASPTLLGQAGGFTNPVFAWSLTGDGALSASGNTSHTQLSVNFPVLATAAPLGKQSTVRVDVTDSDGATAANTFGVRWHYPCESWQTSGAQFQDSPIAFPSNGPARVNGQVSNPMTANEAGITFNIAGKVLGGLLTTAGAMVAIAQPETDPLIIGFVASTGYTLSVLDPPPTPQPYTETGTPGQFQGDVATQVAINQGSTAGIFLPDRPRMNPGLAAAINAAGNYGSYTSDIGGSLTFDCTVYEEQMQQNYTGDTYGQHGYLGSAAGSIVFPGPWQYVWNWSWTPTVAPASS